VVDLHHHGDREVGAGLLDLAVNVHDGPRPAWLDDALRRSLDDARAYPDPREAEAALAARHDRTPAEVLATAGAAEAFTLIARWRPWRRPVVVHPQFTEPHAALVAAGNDVTTVVLEAPFALDPELVPAGADLVFVGNPTNPTGVLHPRATIERLLRPGRVVVVDEAFMDAVPDEPETLTTSPSKGLVVLRSLTKHWGIPGVRAGYLLADAESVTELRRQQTPWSVSSTAIAAMRACSSPAARAESARRAEELQQWRAHLERRLTDLRVEHIASRASFVLARVGTGAHAALRERGIAVRRADTFPGLDASWVRIAVRSPDVVDHLVSALSVVRAKG
jgi:histidinol-phosphate/aromatic aminotransferase/cobyric acid decarboxylase-like protein